jgi:tetratricopeptide (TPR) repeat protein
MSKSTIYLIVVLTITIIPGLASFVSKFNETLGIVLCSLGILGTIIHTISLELNKRYSEKQIEQQNIILASNGLGNVYQQLFEEELKTKGKSSHAMEYLLKAHKIDPTNIEVIKYLSSLIALRFSFARIRNQSIKSDKEWQFAVKIAKTGLKKDSKNFHLMDTLGILNDVAGEHQLARKWFYKSAKYRKDPFWRIMIATSWFMSAEPTKALDEILILVEAGYDHWWVDLNYAMALLLTGEPNESMIYLERAKQKRGWHPSISEYLIDARCFLGKFTIKSFFDLYYLFTLYIFCQPKLAFRLMLKELQMIHNTIVSSTLVFLNKISNKFIYLQLFYGELYFLVSVPCRIGLHYLEQKQYQLAQNFFESCKNIYPKSIPIIISLSAAYALNQNRNKAISLLEYGLLLDPTNKILKWNLNSLHSGATINLVFKFDYMN